MKVDGIALPTIPTPPQADIQIIKADDIKTILYLGIKGEIRLEPAGKHTVDTYA